MQGKGDIWWNIRTHLIIDQNRDLQAFTKTKKTTKTTPLSSNVIESDNSLSMASIVEQPSLNLNWLSKRLIPDRWQDRPKAITHSNIFTISSNKYMSLSKMMKVILPTLFHSVFQTLEKRSFLKHSFCIRRSLGSKTYKTRTYVRSIYPLNQEQYFASWDKP